MKNKLLIIITFIIISCNNTEKISSDKSLYYINYQDTILELKDDYFKNEEIIATSNYNHSKIENNSNLYRLLKENDFVNGWASIAETQYWESREKYLSDFQNVVFYDEGLYYLSNDYKSHVISKVMSYNSEENRDSIYSSTKYIINTKDNHVNSIVYLSSYFYCIPMYDERIYYTQRVQDVFTLFNKTIGCDVEFSEDVDCLGINDSIKIIEYKYDKKGFVINVVNFEEE